MKIREILREGGWDSVVTQGTVINPRVAKAAIAQLQRFIADFNRYRADRQRPPVELGKPLGSTAYHDIDPEDKIYGDIDIQVIAPAVEGLSFTQFTSAYNEAAHKFVQETKPVYVHPTESSEGHPVLQVGRDGYVQVDLIWHPEDLRDWGAARATPEHNLKGMLSGNMYSVLGELLNMSIQHAGVQLKTQNGQQVPFSKQKGVEIQTITRDPGTFILDIFKYEYESIVNRPVNGQTYIDPLLQKFPGNDLNDVKISKMVNGVKGLARSFEKNEMFGQGNLANYSSAQDFIGQFWKRYEEKAMADVANKKRDKAQTPDAIARAQQDRERVLSGLETVKGYFRGA
jgi:hypothetical protein